MTRISESLAKHELLKVVTILSLTDAYKFTSGKTILNSSDPLDWFGYSKLKNSDLAKWNVYFLAKLDEDHEKFGKENDMSKLIANLKQKNVQPKDLENIPEKFFPVILKDYRKLQALVALYKD